MDTGDFIRFTTGVFDAQSSVFFPIGSCVSTATRRSGGHVHAYVAPNDPPDDPRFPEMRAAINEFLRTLAVSHADNYDDREAMR